MVEKARRSSANLLMRLCLVWGVLQFYVARLHARAPTDPVEVQLLVDQLGDSSFRVREDSTKKLTKMGGVIAHQLAITVPLAKDAEIRRRITSVLEALVAQSMKEIRPFRMDVAKRDGLLSLTLDDANDRVYSCGLGSIKRWNYPNGAFEMEFGHVGLAGHNAISVSLDGKLCATGSADGIVRTWNTESGERVMHGRGHSDRVTGVMLSNDGKWVVSTSLDGTIRRWALQHVTGGNRVRTVGEVGRMTSCGNQIAYGCLLTGHPAEARICLEDVSGEAESVVLGGHSARVDDLAYSDDGKRLASVDEKGVIKVWDIQRRQQVTMIEPRQGLPSAIALSRHGTWVYCFFGKEERPVVQISHVDTGRVYHLAGVDFRVYKLLYVRKRNALLCACSDGLIREWPCALYERNSGEVK